MKRAYSFFTMIILGVFIFTGVGKSQDLQETLTNLSNDAAQAYVSPVISAFGANLNSGWVHKSPSSKVFGIDIEVGIVAMATMFGDKNSSFNTNGKFKFNQAQALEMVTKANLSSDASINEQFAYSLSQQEFTVNISGPTIVGKKDDPIIVDFKGADVKAGSTTKHIGAQPYIIPKMGFLDGMKAFPLAAPQFSIGTVYGTMATFRFLPSVKLGDLGKFSYFGFGLQHNPAMFIPVPLPVDVSASFFTQTLKVGEIFKTTATSFGIYASKTFGWGISITPFAGFAVESSSVDVAYDVNYGVAGSAPTKISFSMDGENKTRLTVGASIKLALLNLSVDYSLAKYNSASFGLNFIF